MNELEELKQKILEIGAIMRKLAGRITDWARVSISKIAAPFAFLRGEAKPLSGAGSGGAVPGDLKKLFSAHRKYVIATVLILSLLSGFYVGSALTKTKLESKSAAGNVSASWDDFFKFILGKSIPVVGFTANGSFVFSDFENKKGVKAWKITKGKIQVAGEHVEEGTGAAKVTFEPVEGPNQVALYNLMRSRKGVSDWSGFKALKFYIFNASQEPCSLQLEIADVWLHRYRKDLSLAPGQGESFTIPVDEIAGAMNIAKVNKFAFTSRASKRREIYFDQIMLVPAVTRGDPLKSLKVKDRPVKMFDYAFAYRKPAWVVQLSDTLKTVVQVPFVVKNETNAYAVAASVEGAVPFPMSEIDSIEHLRLLSAGGEAIPFQANILARWPDQTIRWLGLNFSAAFKPYEATGYLLQYGEGIRRESPPTVLAIEEDQNALTVNTGAVVAAFDKRHFYLFKRVYLDLNGNNLAEKDEVVVESAPLVLVSKGVEYRADLDDQSYKIEVEERGDQRAVLKASGWFQSSSGKRFCQAIVRYYFYQGQSAVKVSHTLIYTGYPENKHNPALLRHKLPANETIDSFGMRLPCPLSKAGKPVVRMGQVNQPSLEFADTKSFRLLVKDYMNGFYRTDQGETPLTIAPDGWLDVSDESRGVMVAVRHFRENCPKAIAVTHEWGEIAVDLWPNDVGVLDLATTQDAANAKGAAYGSAFGLAKTHELLFFFHSAKLGTPDIENRGKSFAERFVIRNNPYWLDATGVLGRLMPVDPKYAAQEQVLERLFDWALRQPMYFGWFGMLNFGDTLSWFRNKDASKNYAEFGWHPAGDWGWYNCDAAGTHLGALLQFARSGNWKYFKFGENLARHIMDIDTVHYATVAGDPRLAEILDHRLSQVGAMHKHNGNHWGGASDTAAYTNVAGLFLYYYLTADDRVSDVIREIGAFMLTEPWLSAKTPDTATERALANALWNDVLLYESTWNERYKKAADRIIEILLRGQQEDGSFFENYNQRTGAWSGKKNHRVMVANTLNAVMAYHALTQDEEVKAMLLKLVRYLAPRETEGQMILQGLSYAYLVTGDQTLIASGERNFKKLVASEQASSDPMLSGLLDEKPAYRQPNDYLSTVPYIFGAIEEGIARLGKQQ